VCTSDPVKCVLVTQSCVY